MGKGKRIQDFRNLNLNSVDKNEYKSSKASKSTLLKEELIIEVEEKPSKSEKKKTKENLFYNENQKQTNKNTKIRKKNTKNNSKGKTQNIDNRTNKTYIEQENNKRKKEERKNTSVLISSFLLVFICVGVIAGCLTTPTFDVMLIYAEDGTNVTSGEIQNFFSNVKGKNTYLINTAEIESNIATHPYIFKAEISRKLPDGLEVKYYERKPYSIIKYIESYIFIDKYSSILEIKKENDDPELPVIYGVETEEFIPGQKLEGIAKLKFENVVYLMETAEHVDFDYTISEINYIDAEEIRLLIDGLNVEIIYGKIEREILNDKVTYLNEILKELEDKKGVLDLSSANYSEKVIFTEILK